MWDWAEYIDPDAQMSYMTKAQWLSWNDTGYNNPQFDQWYKEQATLIELQGAPGADLQDGAADRQRPAVHPAGQRGSGHRQHQEWTGFYPDLNAYCKCYYTSPHQT